MNNMRLLNHTYHTATENLALDEALLDAAERQQAPAGSQSPGEVLRFWESPGLAVVLGRGCRAEAEVDLAACRRDGVPVLRRPSGGGTVLVGPGSLMYALVLSLRERPELRGIDAAHRAILERHVHALRDQLPSIRAAGTSDLAINLALVGGERARKFSGNSLRVRRDWILYHGTLLYDFSLDKLSRYLLPPPRQPDYRQDRPHADFVTNVPLDGRQLRAALSQAWQATEPCDLDFADQLTEPIARLVAEKYDRDDWNLQF